MQLYVIEVHIRPWDAHSMHQDFLTAQLISSQNHQKRNSKTSANSQKFVSCPPSTQLSEHKRLESLKRMGSLSDIPSLSFLQGKQDCKSKIKTSEEKHAWENAVQMANQPAILNESRNSEVDLSRNQKFVRSKLQLLFPRKSAKSIIDTNSSSNLSNGPAKSIIDTNSSSTLSNGPAKSIIDTNSSSSLSIGPAKSIIDTNSSSTLSNGPSNLTSVNNCYINNASAMHISNIQSNNCNHFDGKDERSNPGPVNTNFSQDASNGNNSPLKGLKSEEGGASAHRFPPLYLNETGTCFFRQNSSNVKVNTHCLVIVRAEKMVKLYIT